ncbi:MAG: UDP-2,3-diacylglucosamine hydrolase [Lentisphaerae bacterium ADurb.Bin242]|nr:MAG: UDP-2,3-diacylglucosamine hydrolase [Lentisphaerae bacterium ADurb.Bin242]
MMKNNVYVLVADCHICSHSEDEGDFFEMLDRIAEFSPAGVIFLGDIFELWIALDGYESSEHSRFVGWCSAHKAEMEIGFIEGNHEFYVSDTHREAFSWIDDVSHTFGNGIHFIHGDLVNRADRKYLLLRKLVRNPFTRFLLRLTASGIGPAIAEKVRVSLKPTNLQHKRLLPVAHLENYGQTAGREKIHTIFSGHFHVRKNIELPDGVSAEILPAWGNCGEIVLLRPDSSPVCGPWRELLV